MGELMRIGELAAAAGVSSRTVDYYTALNLVVPAERTTGNFRLYDPTMVDRIATVRKLEASGVPLDTICRALNSPNGDDIIDLLRQVDEDLHTLREAAEVTDPDVYGLLTAAIARAHNLIHTALEIALASTPG